MRATRPLAVLSVLAAVAAATPALGQTGGIQVRVEAGQASYQALKDTPFMVSVVKDGAIAQQEESRNNSSVRFDVAPGTYDVRIEGDGAVTLVKRGITVTAGNTTNLVAAPMRAGKGVKIVEYATGGLAREEVAARLARLDAAVDRLGKAVDTLRAERKP